MNKSVQGDLLSAQDELQTLKDELRKAKGKIAAQKTKITKMEGENDMFRKFYARNMADKRQEQTAEIEMVFKDFNKAFQTKDNFINRGMQDLSGLVQDHLSIESRFTVKKPAKLTDSGTEMPDSPLMKKTQVEDN